MSELKAGVIVTPHNEGMCFHRGSDVIGVTESETEFYLKSEADMVIAEKDKDIAILQQSLQSSESVSSYRKRTIKEYEAKVDQMRTDISEKDTYISNLKNDIAEKEKESRHHKYKRGLGIAAVCFEKSYSTTLVKYDKKSGYRLNFYDWWGKRWLELSEKFKEVK